MTGIRQNIFLSALLHAAIIASIIVLGNGLRGAVSRIPEDHLIVSLFEEIASTANAVSIDKNKARGKNQSSVHGNSLLPDTDSNDINPNPEQGEAVRIATKEEVLWLNQHKNGQGEEINITGSDTIKHLSGNRYTGMTEESDRSHPVNNSTGIADGGSGRINTTDIYARIRAAIEKAKIYPVLARKRKIEGTVITEFSINTGGFPEEIKVTKSSGSEILDSAAADIIKKASPFPRVDGHIVIPITFSLKN